MADDNRFRDKFSIKKIGSGKRYKAGSFTGSSKKGLAGALRGAKEAGKDTFAQNLSKKDLRTFRDLIGKKLSKLSAYSSGLPQKARSSIMQKAESLRSAGKISGSDKSDLRNIVSALGPPGQRVNAKTSSSPAVNKVNRAVKFAAYDDQPLITPVRDADKLNSSKRVFRDREVLIDIRYDPRSELGKLEATEQGAGEIPNLRGKEVGLPGIKNLPDV